MAAIELHGLTKRFGAVTAVDDLTLELGTGTVTGFLGPNGAGKTTTLRMLLGLVTPSAGTRHVRRAPLRRPRRPGPPRRRRAGGLQLPSRPPRRRPPAHHRLRRRTARDTGRRSARGWSGWPSTPIDASAGSPSGCANASASPPPCSVNPPCSCSTNPPTGSTPKASTGCARSCATRPTTGAPSSCPATCWPRSPRPSTTS